jgi:hypothetical protein
MPFTFAHPAIILPLTKSKRFSITALIAGSLVPDFEFFFQMREVENIGHHWYGVLLFDFPVALTCCFLFHNLLRNTLVINLPASFRNRLAYGLDFDWNKYARTNKWNISLSLFIGIASHILWDGFTHYDGLIVKMFPVLAAKTSVAGFDIPVYYLLQLVFSVMGLLVVIHVIFRLPQQPSETTGEKNKWYWPLFLVTLSIILGIRLFGWPEYNSFWSIFMAVMGGICYTWILVSVLFKNYLLKKTSL